MERAFPRGIRREYAAGEYAGNTQEMLGGLTSPQRDNRKTIWRILSKKRRILCMGNESMLMMLENETDHWHRSYNASKVNFGYATQ